MTKIPTWFTVVAVVALLWNLLGLAAVVMNFIISPTDVANLPQAQQQMHANTPEWSSYASLLAVITGTLGCLALLIKKVLAYPLFAFSIGGLLIQNFGMFVIVDAISVMGNAVAVMQGFVFLIAVGLLLLAKKAKNQEWIT